MGFNSGFKVLIRHFTDNSTERESANRSTEFVYSDAKFFRLCWWLSFEMWRRVDWYVVTSVLAELTAYFCKLVPK